MPPRIQINARRQTTTTNEATSPLTRRDKDNDDSSSESEKEEASKGICDGKWFTVMCHDKSLELHQGRCFCCKEQRICSCCNCKQGSYNNYNRKTTISHIPAMTGKKCIFVAKPIFYNCCFLKLCFTIVCYYSTGNATTCSSSCC